MNRSVSVSNVDGNGTTRYLTNSNKVTLTFLGILAVLIFVANSAVIYLYKSNRYLRTITNFCLVFLAVSDLLSSLVAIPMIIICNITGLDFPCTTMDLASRFIAISTILHLMIVSTERYIMIVFPMHYIKVVSKPKIIVILLSVWLFSFAVVMIQLCWVMNEVDPSKPNPNDIIHSFTTFFGIVFPVLCFMVFIYSHIFLVIRRQIKSIKKQNFPSSSSQTNELTERGQSKRGEARAVVVFVLMLVTFVLGWFPYFILTFLQDLRISQDSPTEFWLFLRFATSLINPLLYTFLKMDFKRALNWKRKSKMSYKSVETQNETRV